MLNQLFNWKKRTKGKKTAFGLAFTLVAGLLAFGGVSGVLIPPAQASNPPADGSGEQTLFAYVANAGSKIVVSATFVGKTGSYDEDPGWKQAIVRASWPGGKGSSSYDDQVRQNFSGTATVTISKTWTVTEDQAGIWRIQLGASAETGADAALVTHDKNPVVKWDVKVTNSTGTESKGRVWATTLNLHQNRFVGSGSGGKASIDDLSLYYLSNTGVLYHAVYGKFMGIHSKLRVDNFGITRASNCTPLFASEETATLESSTTLIYPASDCPERISYKIFFEKPSVPTSSVPSYTGKNQKPGSDYEPAAINLSWTPTTSATKYHSGVLKVTGVTQPGPVVISLDADGNGSYSDAVDKKIWNENRVGVGATTVSTGDLLDAYGNRISRKVPINMKAEIGPVGEIHFLHRDVEIRANGISAEQLVGPDAGTSRAFAISWDDSRLSYWNSSGAATDICYSSQVSGQVKPCNSSVFPPRTGNKVNSSSGVHRWNYSHQDSKTTDIQQGSYGDERLIDDWAVIEDKASSAIAFSTKTLLWPELEISKDDHRTLVRQGDELTYDIVIKNTSDEFDETNGTVVDYLPKDVEYLSSGPSDFEGKYDISTHTVTWSGVQVPAKGTATRSLTVRVKPGTPSGVNTGDKKYYFTNYVTLESSDPDVPKPTTTPEKECLPPLCFADTDHTIPPKLWVGKDDGVELVQPGQKLVYEVRVSNCVEAESGSKASSVPLEEICGLSMQTAVIDAIPSWTTFVEATDGGVFTPTKESSSPGTVSWPTFALKAGESRTFKVAVTVDDDIPRPIVLKNLVTVADGCASEGCLPPPPETPCEESDDPLIAADCDVTEPSKLTIEKDDHVEVVYPPQSTNQSMNQTTSAGIASEVISQMTYDIVVKNLGKGTEVGAVVVDKLPDYTVFVSATEGGEYNPQTREVTWPAFRLEPGEQKALEVTVTVAKDIPRPYEIPNLVTVTGSGEPKPDCTTTSFADDRCDVDVDHTPPPPLRPVYMQKARKLPLTGSSPFAPATLALALIATGVVVTISRRHIR